MAYDYYTTNDGYQMAYQSIGSESLPLLIMLHGFTGSSQVFQRNTTALSAYFHLILPDLRGHGHSAKPSHGFHVSRLAADLHDLFTHLNLFSTISSSSSTNDRPPSISCVAGSLGCSILWSYAELYTPSIFSAMVWIDQSPMQNYALDGSWGVEYGNRGMNCESAVRTLKETLSKSPDEIYRGTIAACLAYRSHPLKSFSDDDDHKKQKEDEDFFLSIAQQGNPEWYGDLMANHTGLDWRASIAACYGDSSHHHNNNKQKRPRVLVIASNRSGCFPAAGPMKAVELINSGNNSLKESDKKAKGIVIDWGGHWCYWEDPERFNEIVLEFLLQEKGQGEE